MAHKFKQKNKKLAFLFLEYGFMLWLLLFISNAAIFWGFSYFIRAQVPDVQTAPTSAPTLIASEIGNEEESENFIDENEEDTELEEEASPTEALPTVPLLTPIPKGPVVSLSFSLPGISTQGGNLTPVHSLKDVEVLLYNPDANVLDPKSKPQHSVKTRALFDDDPNSPTYTFFVNTYVDLGAKAASKPYQIALKTQQSLAGVIREADTKGLGGEIYTLRSRRPETLPHVNLITGDIYPAKKSDNVMDINDYNMLVNCFSFKAFSSRCVDEVKADLDDNGVVDGVDYNLMLLSFQILKAQGFPVPSVFTQNPVVINPTVSSLPGRATAGPAINEEATQAPAASSRRSSSGNGFVGIVIFLLFLVIAGVGGFVAFKMHLLDGILGKLPFLKKGQPGDGAANADPNAQPPGDAPQGSEVPNEEAGQTDAQATESAGEPPDQQPEQAPADQGQIQNSAQDPTADQKQQAQQTGQTTQPVPNTSNQTQPVEQSTQPSAEPTTIVSKSDLQTGSPQNQPAETAPPDQSNVSGQTTAPTPPSAGGMVEKSGYVKKVRDDAQAKGVWLTVADDSGITRGFYQGHGFSDGFSKVKGTMMKDAENKPFLQITELTPEAA